MDTQVTRTPLTYDSTFETIEPDEQATTNGLIETLHNIFKITFKVHGCPFRGVHAKSQGILQGNLEILPGLPEVLAQGLFAKPASYPLVMRFSTIPGDIVSDDVSVPRGLAVKVLGVEGDRLPGSEGDNTQDFLLVNGPAFAAPNPGAFLKTLKLLALTTEKFPRAKIALSHVMRVVHKLLAVFGTKSGLVMTLGGHPTTHVLGETYYSQAPILYGAYIAKFCLVPSSPALVALTDKPVDVVGHPDGLRDAVVEFFHSHDAEWELRVQLCTDLASMPIEDPSVPWPEELSPYIAVARLKVASQPAWNVARERLVDQGMSFSPWHGLKAHRPLGSVMRVRKAIYAQAAQWRAQSVGAAALAEPRSLAELSQPDRLDYRLGEMFGEDEAGELLPK